MSSMKSSGVSTLLSHPSSSPQASDSESVSNAGYITDAPLEPKPSLSHRHVQHHQSPTKQIQPAHSAVNIVSSPDANRRPYSAANGAITSHIDLVKPAACIGRWKTRLRKALSVAIGFVIFVLTALSMMHLTASTHAHEAPASTPLKGEPLMTRVASFLPFSSDTAPSSSPAARELVTDPRHTNMHSCMHDVANRTRSHAAAHNQVTLHSLHYGLHTIMGDARLQVPVYRDTKQFEVHSDAESTKRHADRRVQFHLYWERPTPTLDGRCKCAQCIHKLLVLLRSWIATQSLHDAALNLWTGDAQSLLVLQAEPLLQSVRPFVRLRLYSANELAQDSPLAHSPVLQLQDERHYLQSDLARYLILYQHGGVYVDTDSIFLNDMTPLAEGREWWPRWACTADLSPGLLFMRRRSLLARDVLQTIADTAVDPESGGYSWGRDLLTRVYDANVLRLEAQQASEASGTDFLALKEAQSRVPLIVPACYFYPQWCAEGFHGYFDSPSTPVSGESLYLDSFVYHWHGGGGSRYAKTVGRQSQFDETRRLVDRLMAIKFGRQTIDLETRSRQRADLDSRADSFMDVHTSTGDPSRLLPLNVAPGQRRVLGLRHGASIHFGFRPSRE